MLNGIKLVIDNRTYVICKISVISLFVIVVKIEFKSKMQLSVNYSKGYIVHETKGHDRLQVFSVPRAIYHPDSGTLYIRINL